MKTQTTVPRPAPPAKNAKKPLPPKYAKKPDPVAAGPTETRRTLAGDAGDAAEIQDAARSIFKGDADKLVPAKGSDGRTYLIMRDAPAATVPKLVEMNRRMRVLLDAATEAWGAGDERVVRMSFMLNAKASRINQMPNMTIGGIGGKAGAGGWIWFSRPSQQNDAENMDSVIHEMSHVLCGGGPNCSCRGIKTAAPWAREREDASAGADCPELFMYHGHGPRWNQHQIELRKLAHPLGLRGCVPHWGCYEECGNFGCPKANRKLIQRA